MTLKHLVKIYTFNLLLPNFMTLDEYLLCQTSNDDVLFEVFIKIGKNMHILTKYGEIYRAISTWNSISIPNTIPTNTIKGHKTKY